MPTAISLPKLLATETLRFRPRASRWAERLSGDGFFTVLARANENGSSVCGPFALIHTVDAEPHGIVGVPYVNEFAAAAADAIS